MERRITSTKNEQSKQKSQIGCKRRQLLGSWSKGIFDTRVFDLSAQRYRNLELAKTKNELEKKRQYNRRVLEVENSLFTPLVFSSNGGMGREFTTFYTRLSEMYAEKKKQPMHEAIKSIRTKISFSLMRSTIRCLRGSRSRKPSLEDLEQNIRLNK